MNKFVQQEKYLIPILWVMFFCYAICMALIFQNVIIPNVPSLQGVGKLLPNDAVYFDAEAWALAEDINANGWSRWQLFISPTAPGNVAILGALYALFGHDSTLIIPINASMHALGGVLIFLLSAELATKKTVGVYAGLIAGLLFIIFPSALMWYGQLHKDGYSIAGTLLILLMWVKVIKRPENIRSWMRIAIGSFIGIGLVLMVRPYSLTLFFFVGLGAMLVTIVFGVCQYKSQDIIKQSTYYIVFLAVLLSGIVMTKSVTSQINLNKTVVTHVTQIGNGATWQWQNSQWLPEEIEKYISAAAKKRVDLVAYGLSVNARSTIDGDVTPKNIAEVIMYLPRAFQIASMAPFPNQWFSRSSLMRLIAAGEMIVYYLCIIGFIFLLRFERKPAVWLVIYFATAFLVILGFTIANMGTLFRLRYAYLLVMLMLGVLGWISFLDYKGTLVKISRLFSSKADLSLKETFSEHQTKKRKKAVGSGIYVMVLTFLGFIGFFYRDILMAHAFGLGSELDAFFVALLIPMTVVTIICMPLGAAFTPVFLEAIENDNKKNVQALISSISSGVLIILFCICIALYLLEPFLLPFITSENIVRIQELTTLALPILFFSGSVILGNAILNAMGKVVVSSVAQLIVPIVAITLVIFFGEKYGVSAAMIGMLTGQLINLVIVQANVKKCGYTLFPQFNFKISIPFKLLTSQYVPLVASAFFVSIAVLVNTLLAMVLPEGGVSIFNLGNKVVLLATGLVGAAISTVMLPYFSALVAKNHIVAARKELSVFLLFLTFFSIPISVIIFVWSDWIVDVIFKGGLFGKSDVSTVARVMQYAVVQVPFFSCNVLLLKFATATKHVNAILVAASLGLVINVGASLLLMKHMGVAGIALGASLSMAMATTFLVIILVRYRHIVFVDMIIILLSWLLYITLLISVHFESMSGIVVTIFTYLILLASYSRSIQSNEGEFRLVG